MSSTIVVYNKIKAVLAEKRTSNKELAAHMDVYEQTVSNWCTNKSQPRIEDFHKIARFLNRSVFDLMVERPYEEELKD
jgi:putative transcriptional regulator